VAKEVIANAVSAATRDPRFEAVSPEELDGLEYSVDVLTAPEPIKDESQLDPKKYGIIVEAGWRRGLLLPDLEGVDTVDYQIDISRQKAGIGPNEPVKLYRFQVKRYK
jgi:AMMECR1 domain-containing protein